MKKITLLIGFLLTIPVSHAWIIGNQAKEKGEASACRILYRDDAGKLKSICSGTLVTSSKIITAAHCIQENPASASVECGYQGSDPDQVIEETGGGSRVVTTGTHFSEKRTDVIPRMEKGVDPNNTDQDVGVIDLKTPITSIEPADFSPTSLKDFFQTSLSDEMTVPRIRDNSECKIEGYGVNNEGTSGRLMSAPFVDLLGYSPTHIDGGETVILQEVTDPKLAEIQNCVLEYHANMIPKNFVPLAKLFSGSKIFEGSVTHGDSGGPLYCRKKGTEKWTLVGVASKGGFGTQDKVAKSSTGWHTLSKDDWSVLIEGKPRPAKVEHKIKLEDLDQIDLLMMESKPPPIKGKKPSGKKPAGNKVKDQNPDKKIERPAGF